MLKNDLVLRAARREKTERTPVWLMRQAGRTDPAYRALREKVTHPLEILFRDADFAVEASLLPVRFGVDAVIIYQDILTILAPMGANFVFRPGPELKRPLTTAADFERLGGVDPASDMDYVGKTIRGVRKELDGRLPVFGFAGAPLTLAMFMLAGKSPGPDAKGPLAALESSPADVHKLLNKLTDATIDYLAYQIDEGVDAYQVFESMADVLTPKQYATFAQPYHVRIFSALKGRAPGILFAKEYPDVALMVESGADMLSVGRCVDLAAAKAGFGHKVAFQGNVDNAIVEKGSLDQIDEEVHRCVQAGNQEGHILNLNHGLLKDTPFDHVQRVIQATGEASRACALDAR